uniref:RING-type domain-containing protein n=1 Tax=Plectus sambesii TaxID=2011161 RepID=A0A914VKW7_9BILA
MAEDVQSPDGEPIWGRATPSPPRSTVVLRQRPTSAEIDVRLALMRDVDMRLKSFRLLRWPKSDVVDPELLARAGFFFEGKGDTVRCAYCTGRLNNWQIGDEPLREHANNFPECSFVQTRIESAQLVANETNASEPSSSCTSPSTSCARYSIGSAASSYASNDEEHKRHELLKEFGIFSHGCAKRLDFATYQARLDTFSGWPPDCKQKPAELAKAGFFYAGHHDNVKCFCCDGGLRNWRPEDSIVAEHLKWFPQCDFARLCCASSETQSAGRRRVTSSNRSQSPPHRTMAYLRRMGVDISADQIVRCKELGVESELIVDAVSSNAFSLFETSEQLLARIIGLNEERSIRTEMMESDNRACKICMDNEITAVLLPCGHLCCCALCAPPLANCPICRVDVKGFVKAFLC